MYLMNHHCLLFQANGRLVHDYSLRFAHYKLYFDKYSLFSRRVTAYVGPDSNPTFDSWRPGWRKGFAVVELVINRKFHQEVTDSRVGRTQSIHSLYNLSSNILKKFFFPNGPLNLQGIKSLPRTDYDIAALRLDYPIIDEISGMTLLKVSRSLLYCYSYNLSLQDNKFSPHTLMPICLPTNNRQAVLSFPKMS